MSGGGTSQPVTTQTTTSSPWSGAQPALLQMYQGAGNLVANNQGYQPYLGPTMAPLDPSVYTGLGNTENIATQQMGYLPQFSIAGLNNLVNLSQTQGITPGVSAALGGLGQAAGQYGNIYQQAQGATNPYLQASIDAANQRGNAAIQSSMSAAGRYGSGQYQDVMSRAQAQVADPLLMQDYEARQARALQATQGLGQTYGQQAGIYQQGIGQGMQALQGMGPLAQAAYTPGQMQLAAGQYLTDYGQQTLQGQIAQYNALQAYPWQQLQRESAILSGAGTLGGEQVTAMTPQQTSLMSRLAGGALVGGGLGTSIGGPVGGGLGAGIGALAGAFL